MSSECGDVLSLQDLQTAKKHQLFEAEVITGLQGGVTGGTPIDYATNQVTGQTQKTLPAVLRDAGFRPASFTFVTGGTLNVGDSDMAVLWPISGGGDGQYYIWKGAYPKTIPAASTPASTGGVSNSGWLPLGDITLRTELASSAVGKGASLVKTTNNITVEQEIVNVKQSVVDITYANFSDASRYKNSLEDGGTVNIACFGDSTMWGSTSLNSTVQNAVNPPAILQRTLDLLFGAGKATVTNNAIRGTALFSMLAGTDGSGSTFEAKMQTSTASLVYCNHAQNDCNSLLRTVLQYKADLVTFVNICRKYGKVPVLVTPNLTVVLDGITEQTTKRLPAFVDAMREVAKEMGVDLVDNHYYTVKASRYVRWYDMVPDGVHPGTDVYYMCGSNLAIPLVAHRVLYKPGDATGLSNVRYRDNISSGRNFSNADNLFSKQLSWNAIAGQSGVWFPFVLDNPTDDTVISICGFQWGNGGKTIIGYKDSLSDVRLSGTIDQYRTDATDESAYFVPQICKLLPGLHVINLLNHTASGGTTSSFSGIKLIKRQDTGAGYPANSGFDAARLIHANDVVVKDVYVNGSVGASAVLLTLRDTRTQAQQTVTVSNSAGTITVGMANGTTATLGTGVQTGFYTLTVTLNNDRTITVQLGALSVTTTAASTPLSTSFVSTSGTYSVRKS